jgi:hypothetical protein
VAINKHLDIRIDIIINFDNNRIKTYGDLNRHIVAYSTSFDLRVRIAFNRLYQIANSFAIGSCLLDDYQVICRRAPSNWKQLFEPITRGFFLIPIV